MSSIRFSKLRASERATCSDYTGCKVSAAMAHASLGINVVPAKAHPCSHTQIKQTLGNTYNSLTQMQAYQKISNIDNSNQAFIRLSGDRLQGEIMDLFMRKTDHSCVLHSGTIPISYETILKEARCK